MSLKNIYIIVLFLSPAYLFGQDSIYFDSNWKKVKSQEPAKYYEVIKHDSTFTIGQEITYLDKNNKEVKSFDDTTSYSVVLHELTNSDRKVERQFTKNGKLMIEKHLIDVPDEKDNIKTVSKLDGKYKYWYNNSQIKQEIDYKYGKYDGKILSYWANGQLKREDKYEYGKFIQGKCFNDQGKEIEYFLFEIMPEYPGGVKSLTEQISNILRYPANMQKQGIQGKVKVGFIVGKDGHISDVAIITGVNADLDEEAIRVVKKLHDFKPGMYDGENVSVHYTIPISFTLQ